MKTKHILFAVSLFFFCKEAVAQTCTITISGDTCRGKAVKAITSDGILKKLSWSNSSETLAIRTRLGYQSGGITAAGGNGFGSTPDKFYSPNSVCVDENGNIYVSDLYNQFVTKWIPGDTTGTIVAGGHGSGDATNQLKNPVGIALDKAGNLYVADGSNNRIVKWLPGATDGIVIAENITGLADIYVDAEKNIYILHNETVEKWDAGTHTRKIVAGGNGSGSALNQFNGAEGMYADESGNVYVADKFNNRVMKWLPNASAGIIAAGGNGAGNAAGKLYYPTDVFVDKNGNVFVLDFVYNRVQLWAPGAKYGITVISGTDNDSSALQFDDPESLWLDSKGSLYVLDGGNRRVQKFIPSPQVFTEFIPAEIGSYKVKGYFENGCIAESSVIEISSEPLNYGIITGPVYNLCLPDTVRYSQYSMYATSYNWYMPPGLSIISGQGTGTITVAVNHFVKGTLTVEPTNSCGHVSRGTELHRFPDKPGYVQGPLQVHAGQTGIVYYLKKPEDHVTYTWQVPDGVTLISGQGTGSITVNWGSGPGYIYVQAANDCGEFLSPRIQYIGVIPAPMATTNQIDTNSITHNQPKLKLYPNPAETKLNIDFQGSYTGQKTIIVFDLFGRKLITKSAAQNLLQLDVSKLMPGSYFIKIFDTNSRQFYSGRFIKQN